MFKITVIRVLDASRIAHVLRPHLLQCLPLVHLLDRLLQVLQPEDQHGDVVEGAACSCFAKHNFNTLSRCNVLIVVKLLLGARPVNLVLPTPVTRVDR